MLSLIDYEEWDFDVKKHIIPTQEGIENTNKFIFQWQFKHEIGGVWQIIKGLGHQKNIFLSFRIFKRNIHLLTPSILIKTKIGQFLRPVLQRTNLRVSCTVTKILHGIGNHSQKRYMLRRKKVIERMAEKTFSRTAP